MFMESKDGRRCGLFCSCGCEDGVVLSAEKDEGFGCYLSLVSDNWYICNLTGLARLKEKCKRIWKVLANQEYCYFHICIEDKDINEFKDFVAKL